MEDISPDVVVGSPSCFPSFLGTYFAKLTNTVQKIKNLLKSLVALG